MFRTNDGINAIGGVVNFVVDDDVVVFVGEVVFPFGLCETLLDDVVIFGAATAKPVFQSFLGRGNDEDEHGIRHFFPDLESALDFDFEDDFFAFRKSLLDEEQGGSVIFSHEFRIFQESSFPDVLEELVSGDKEIIHAVNFSGAWFSGGHGNRIREVIVRNLEKGFPDRALPDTGRTAHDDQQATFVQLHEVAPHSLIIIIISQPGQKKKNFFRIIDVWYNEKGDHMSMDGRFIRKLAEEMNENLTNGRINKLYQLSRTDFLFLVHRDGVLSQWFLSLSLQNPRMHLSWKTYDKPAAPTGFCMLLRKHLEGGVIREIGVLNEDRIIRAVIENRNDFGEKVSFHLIAELMGKYANLIVTEPDGTIIDCHKRVSPFDGQQRAFLKGLKYELPADGKLAPSDAAGVENFFQTHPDLDEKTLVDGIRGFSPLSATYFLRALSGRPATRMELFRELEDHPVEPTVCLRDGKARYYFFDVFEAEEKKTHPSLSKLLDETYFEAGQLERTKQVSKNIYQLIKREYEKNKDKLEKQTRELKEAKNGEIQRIFGDMIRQYSPSLQKGDDRLSAFSYELGKDV